jgi:hypothetical protein
MKVDRLHHRPLQILVATRRPLLQPLLDGDVESVEDGTRFD